MRAHQPVTYTAASYSRLDKASRSLLVIQHKRWPRTRIPERITKPAPAAPDSLPGGGGCKRTRGYNQEGSLCRPAVLLGLGEMYSYEYFVYSTAAPPDSSNRTTRTTATPESLPIAGVCSPSPPIVHSPPYAWVLGYSKNAYSGRNT